MYSTCTCTVHVHVQQSDFLGHSKFAKILPDNYLTAFFL